MQKTLCRVGFRVLVAPDKSLSWDPHSGWSSVSRNWWDSILHVLLAKKHMGCTTRQSCGIWEVFATIMSAREFEFMWLICLSAKFSKSTSYQNHLRYHDVQDEKMYYAMFSFDCNLPTFLFLNKTSFFQQIMFLKQMLSSVLNTKKLRPHLCKDM